MSSMHFASISTTGVYTPCGVETGTGGRAAGLGDQVQPSGVPLADLLGELRARGVVLGDHEHHPEGGGDDRQREGRRWRSQAGDGGREEEAGGGGGAAAGRALQDGPAREHGGQAHGEVLPAGQEGPVLKKGRVCGL
eukprot:1193132-Prorocentrum_minimum.AAC.2